MISKDYKGPVSGRITIGGGSDPEVKRESFTQDQDPVLTRDELNATAWFRALPPNEQLREVRRLKWNADERQRTIIANRRVIAEQDAEILRLRAELSQITPLGYMWPPAASELFGVAKAAGWKTAYAWQVIKPRDEEDDHEPYARLETKIQHADGRSFRYTWSCRPGGGGRLVRSGLAWAPYRGWHDAPSLIKLKKMITDDQ